MRKATFNIRCGCSENESRHSAVNRTVSEYVQRSTIHGVAYVGDNERNKFERIWWFLMLVFSVFGACYLIYQAYRTMKENPIIESPSLTRIPIWEVPFPAATFCPITEYGLTSFALNKTNWPDFAQNLLPENFTKLTVDGVFYSSLMLETLLLRSSDQNNYDILRQFLPENEIMKASFGTVPKTVDVSLQQTITHFGACLTFNMYQEKDILRGSAILSSLHNTTDKAEQLWSRDYGFNNNLPLENYTYPFRSFGPGDAFTMTFFVNHSQLFTRFGGLYTVAIHPSDEIPIFGRHSETISVTPGKVNSIEITPQLVVSEGIEHYAPDVRQCYYSNERYLKFYKNYTQGHCEWECLANYTRAQCGCKPYHLPHSKDDKLCTTIADFECLLYKTPLFFFPNFKDDAGRAPVDGCKCLPSCTQLLYKPVLTLSAGNFPYTWVSVANKYPHLEKRVRTELHSISEFFSNCGGSLGLFLGVSIFSIVELLYFCTVRLYLHSKKQKISANSNE